jgi:hypothetical protein
VDAIIGRVIKRLVGYPDDRHQSLAEQAIASSSVVMTSPGVTSDQAMAIGMSAPLDAGDATKNAHHRGQQVARMEHVLRFLIARQMANPLLQGRVELGVDYDLGTGILGDALQIVNGGNRFNRDRDPATNDLLYRGVLDRRTFLSIKDGVVYFSDGEDWEPVWPPEQVADYRAEQR